MYKSINRLGIILVGILLFLFISSAILFVKISSNYYVMAVGILIMLFIAIFIGYLLFDLIRFKQKDKE